MRARFRDEGAWEQILSALRERCRKEAGREATPSAGIIESQSVKTTERGGMHGYDGAREDFRQKTSHPGGYHRLAAASVVVPVANLQEREGVQLLLEPIKGIFPRMKKVWVDQGYTGKGREWIEREMGWGVEVVRHPWRARGEWGRACGISMI